MIRRSQFARCVCVMIAAAAALSLGRAVAEDKVAKDRVAQDNGEESDATTTVKESFADSLPGKWRAKFEIDEEKLKKEGGAEAAEIVRGLVGKTTIVLEVNAGGTYVVSMEGAPAELGGAQTQKGQWKLIKEDEKDEKRLTLEFFDNDHPEKMEIAFESADRFTLMPKIDNLGPLKPPVFNRVKEEKKDEKEKKGKDTEEKEKPE